MVLAWQTLPADLSSSPVYGLGFQGLGFVAYVAVLDGLLEVITGVAEALGVGGAVRKVSSHTCFQFPEREANKRSQYASHSVPLFRLRCPYSGSRNKDTHIEAKCLNLPPYVIICLAAVHQ